MSFGKKKVSENTYENSTQRWLPIDNIRNGIILMKDKRCIKIVEVMPVNFYLKSEVEQENIIYFFSAYLKIAPDNLQIRILTQRADIEDYLERLEERMDKEENENCRKMIDCELSYVKGLSDNVAVKKRFFIVFEHIPRAFSNDDFTDAVRKLADEAYKAQRYLAQCGLDVVDIQDDGQLIDLFYGVINKYTSKYVKPGSFAGTTFDEIHVYEGGNDND